MIYYIYHQIKRLQNGFRETTRGTIFEKGGHYVLDTTFVYVGTHCSCCDIAIQWKDYYGRS